MSVECPHCGKVITKKNLNTHIKRVHEGQKFECRTCKQRLSSKYRLNQHFSLSHNGQEIAYDLITETVDIEPKLSEAEKDAIIAEQREEIGRLQIELSTIRRSNTEKRKQLSARPQKNRNTKKVQILQRRSYT